MIEDEDKIDSVMDGKIYKAGRFAYELRTKLMMVAREVMIGTLWNGRGRSKRSCVQVFLESTP